MSVKLMIRADKESNLVRAFFAKLDDSEHFEVATINLGICLYCEGAFESWKKLLTAAMVQGLTETGHLVQDVVECKPGEAPPP